MVMAVVRAVPAAPDEVSKAVYRQKNDDVEGSGLHMCREADRLLPEWYWSKHHALSSKMIIQYCLVLTSNGVYQHILIRLTQNVVAHTFAVHSRDCDGQG